MIKYYNVIRIVVVMLLIGLLASPSQAALLSSSASPDKTYKCGTSTISASFDNVGIVDVDAILTSKKAVHPMIPGSGRITLETQSTTVSMTHNGTHWVGIFGNDNTLLWGERSISFKINTDVITTYGSSSEVFVYSGICTGTDKNFRQNYTECIGTYTNMLCQGDMDLLTWSLYPWLQYWGYLFYVMVLLITCLSIYMKTQNAMHVLLISIAFLLVLATSGAIPLVYRSYVLTFGAVIIGAVFYRIFVRD